ncbi:MAG: type I-U CRISPR-associated protein Cas8c [bacterium]|nr:type I-U CRISPR-associated protein Cas8c [bacterium]
MSDVQPNITIPVDLTNPGQFFACCGLLELADRLWPGAVGSPSAFGWFEPKHFCILTADKTKTLAELLSAIAELKTWINGEIDDPAQEDDEGDSEESEKEPPFQPFTMKWSDGRDAIFLNWWSETSIKPWAGSMKDRTILRAMLAAINTSSLSPFDDVKAVFDPMKTPKLTTDGKKPRKQKPKKREPFYFDPRRGNKSHPLDSGFSPDVHKMQAQCCPALEALCFIGLQRARPASTGVANQSRYTVWSRHIPANLIGPVVCGILPIPGSSNYVFNNYFRTNKLMHKTFSQATLVRSIYV